MSDKNTPMPLINVSRLIPALLSSRWLETLAELWMLWRQIASGILDQGLYEVLEYEGTLELLDKRGVRAQFRKREKVRYLQNSTIAYQDQAWGDGKILLNYK